MEENAELQAKIAALAGRINRHKASDTESAPSYSRPAHHTYGMPALSHLYSQAEKHQDYGHYGYNSWAPQRGTPYGVPRGRGRGYASAAPVHRNRTLVVNVSGSTTPTSGDTAASTPNGTPSTSGSGWVSKRDRHMQLINTAVYDQKTQQRSQAMAETRQQKLRAKEEREKLKLQNHFQSLASFPQQRSSAPVAHEIFVNDIKFVVTDGGSKLIKVSDPINSAKETPKRTNIGGVTFVRSKHGNLYRSGFIKTKRLDFWTRILEAVPPANRWPRSATDVKKIAQPCPQFSTTGTNTPRRITSYARRLRSTAAGGSLDGKLTLRTGTCAKGPLCRYEHDPEKVAICRDFLSTGECQAGVNCDLSHDPTPERVPACLHFLRGNCTNPECRYAHVRTNPSAPVCRAFATLGYCSKGAECSERHVFECPDFTNKGICRNKKCRLPHVHRAGQLRKAAAMQKSESDEGPSSDISSDDEMDAYDSDDVDSDDFEEDVAMLEPHPSELSQQVDFVKF